MLFQMLKTLELKKYIIKTNKMNAKGLLREYRDEANFIYETYGLKDLVDETELSMSNIYSLMRKFAEHNKVEKNLSLPNINDWLPIPEINGNWDDYALASKNNGWLKFDDGSICLFQHHEWSKSMITHYSHSSACR